MKHIVITDSGVGGLSVVAYAERSLRTNGPVRLTFANAAPANDFGYNAMKTREEKIETFDRFLRNVTQRYQPDAIYVACNTLSVLLGDTPFFQSAPVPVEGIVETGVALILRELARDPKSVAMVFATQTTIDAGTYPRLLQAAGIEASRIVGQACPGLADTISEDREGMKTRREIERWVGEARGKMREPNAPIVAALACTHYGYRKGDFAASLPGATVINPNESAVSSSVFSVVKNGFTTKDTKVRVITRYAIPETTIDALTFFLEDISPKTVAALRDFEHVPDLF